jgi:hypothetical protein
MRRPRIDPLYVVAAVLLVVVIALGAFVGLNAQSQVRTGSALDRTSGGASDLRALLEDLGARVSFVQGDRFAPRDSGVKVLFMLGATEPVGDTDLSATRTFLQGGGTVILATDFGFSESGLLRAFGLGFDQAILPSDFATAGVIAAPARARVVTLDRGRTLTLSDRWSPVLLGESGTAAAVTREGSGTLVVVGSLAPFVNALIGAADNGRFALSLAAGGFGPGRSIGFDEYHHGAHPSPELLAVLERTWLGRAMLLAGGIVFVYLLWSGRRFGPPLPADPRPARSSLDYVRGFAGLLRRSGRDEIARERLRRELRAGLSAKYGLDPATPFERVLATADAEDPHAAAEARAADAALAHRLRESELLRTVARIQGVIAKKEGT